MSSAYWSENARGIDFAGPRSYYVRTERKKVYRKNRHMLRTPETYSNLDDNNMSTKQPPDDDTISQQKTPDAKGIVTSQRNADTNQLFLS